MVTVLNGYSVIWLYGYSVKGLNGYMVKLLPADLARYSIK